MDHAEFVAMQWRSLIDILEAFQSGRLGVTETSRKVVAIQDNLEEFENPLFTAFVAVESETDQFPLGEARARWSMEAGSTVDAEREATEQFYHPHLSEACEPLLSYAKVHAL